MTGNRLLYISQLGTPDMHDPSFYADLPDAGDDRRWVENRLREWGVLGQIDYQTASITLGEGLPDPVDFDAVIVGGSFHSINENQPWQKQLMNWLATWRETGRPALGICGGHQMMCVMAGCEVVPRANGVKGTSAPITITKVGQAHPLFEGFDEAPEFHFGNFDHVLEAPEGTAVLASDADSPRVFRIPCHWHSLNIQHVV
jgi:GMP synthase-like glutamine amidotransferase